MSERSERDVAAHARSEAEGTRIGAQRSEHPMSERSERDIAAHARSEAEGTRIGAQRSEHR